MRKRKAMPAWQHNTANGLNIKRSCVTKSARMLRKDAGMSSRPPSTVPVKVWKSALRQRAFKDRMADAGMVQLNFWVPAAALADVKRAGELMRANPHLTVERLVDARSGKFVGLKEKKP